MYTLPQKEIDHTLAPYQIFRIRDVIKITGLARSTIYAQIGAGKFPRPLRLGVRAVGWSANEIFQWLAGRDVAV